MGKPAGHDLAADLMRVCEALEVRYGRRKHAPVEDVIEALVSQILELGVPEKSSREAMKRVRDEFLGWNDMRVATIREIEDVLGPKYPKVRERAEDLKHLLADLYTAFRRMDIREALAGDGIETLRALPDTSNIRRDFVDRALLLALNLKVFPCDEEQIRLLKFLGGVPKQLTLQQARAKIEEALDDEGMSRLSRVLREHVALYQAAGEDEPQPISFQWDQPDPLGMDKAKPATKGTSKVEKSTAKVEKPEKVEKAEKVEKKPATAKVEKPTAKLEKDDKPKADKPKTDKKPEAKAEKKPEPKADKKPATAKVEKPATKPAKKDDSKKKK
jgi:endonuclease III